MPASPSADLQLVEELTPREREILTCFAGNLSDRDIADKLVLSLNTVKWYARQIFGKLGVENRRMAVLRAQELGLLAEATSSPTLQSELPIWLTPFVGREQELQELLQLLAEEKTRLLTLVGPGGMGKTRLAVQVVRGLAEEQPQCFADGAYFVPLAALREWQMMVTAIAHAVGFLFQPEGGSPAQQLADYLRNKQMLLALDNFEHLITSESNQLLLDLLAQAPRLKLLITSRSQLRIHGEQLFHLSGLGMPELSMSGQQANSRIVAGDYDALRLVEQCVRQLRADVPFDEATLDVMVRICRAVDGMPLAIELATSWIEVLSLEEIAAEVERNLELLESDAQGIPERQRSLRLVCDYSWRLLTAPEQEAMQQMAVFRGGFDRSAAEAIAGANSRLLLALVSKSWLQRGSDNRFTIHEALRQYCTEKLSQDPQSERAAAERHSAYYCKWISQQEEALKGAEQRAALDAIAAELANVLEGFRWAARHAQTERLAEATNSLGSYIYLTDEWQTGLRLFAECMAALPPGADAYNNTPPVTLHLARARLATQICILTRRSDDGAAFRASFDQALSLLNSPDLSTVDTRQERARIALQFGRTHYMAHADLAVKHLSESYALYHALDDKEGMAAAQLALGRAYRTLGVVEKARAALLKGLAHYEEIGQAFGQSDALGGLSTIALVQGDFVEAERYASQGLAIVPETIRYQRTYLLPLLGFAQFQRGLFAEAETALTTAINMRLEDGDVGLATANRIVRLIPILLHQGKYAEALQQIDATHSTRGQAGISNTLQSVIEYVHPWIHGMVALAQSHFDEAYQQLEQVLARWRPLVYARYDKAGIIASLALALRGLGRHEEAQVQLAAALYDALESRAYLGLLPALIAAALLELDRENETYALELYATAAAQPLVAHSTWYADVAGKEFALAAGRVTDEVAATARLRGEKADLWESAETLYRRYYKDDSQL
jgi:predicted ATPase/DNA-binding CsgD family transcriptional regulator